MKVGIVNIVNKVKRMYILAHSLFICLRLLPLKQALKIPIVVHNKLIIKGIGSVRIDSDVPLFHGMIDIGSMCTNMYSTGRVYISLNGKIVFKGKCHIGNDSFIYVGKDATLLLGDGVYCTAKLRIMSEKGIRIGDGTLLGWDTTIMDTNFHSVCDMTTNAILPSARPINIGKNNWFGMECVVLPGVYTANDCIFGLRSVLTSSTTYESNCSYGGNPLRKLRSNVRRVT